MSQDRLYRSLTGLRSADPSSGRDPALQLKESVAGLSYQEQVQRLRPPMPLSVAPGVQMKEDTAPVQRAPDEAAEGGGGAAPGSVSGPTVSINAAGEVTISGAKVTVSAGAVDLNAGLVNVPGVVQAGTVITDSVVAASYSPGAGNVM